MPSKRHLLQGLALSVTLLAGLLPASAGARTPLPDIVKGKGDACVEPTEVMRSDHMKFLRHQRDATVHEGIRTKRHSLKQCIECHATRDPGGKPVPVTAPGQFCQSCHSYAGVSLDCFSCHATIPEN
jgi:hypothetical protein